MTHITTLVDWIFAKTFLIFRNTLGGVMPDLPETAPLPGAPKLAPPEDYEALATLYSNRYRGAFVLNFSLGFVAVLLALIPLSGLLSDHALHAAALPLTVAEVLCIVIIMLIYWYGRDTEAYAGHGLSLPHLLRLPHINQGWRQRWSHARLAYEHVRYSRLMLGFPGAQLHASSMLDSAGDRYQETAAALRALAAQYQPVSADAAYIAAYRIYFLSQIVEQRAYHQYNQHRYHRIHHVLHQIASWSFYATLIACVAHLAFHHAALSVLAALLPALAATCHGILASGEFHKLSEQSKEMHTALGALEQQVRAGDEAALPALESQVRAFFDLAVQDAIGWHVTLRDKDVQVV